MTEPALMGFLTQTVEEMWVLQEASFPKPAFGEEWFYSKQGYPRRTLLFGSCVHQQRRVSAGTFL